MKASIKVITAQKEFSKADMDCFRRILNVLRSHDLAARLTIKRKVITHYEIQESKLKIV